MRAANARRIVNSGIGESGILAKLRRPCFRQFLHFRFRPEMQAARRARLDASRLEAYRHAVIAQRALENFARRRTEFWNIERTARHAIAAADAVRFLEINDSVGILHDGAIRRASRQAARIFAVHALIFAHQQHHAAVFALVLVELDQVPVIPRRLGHGLVGVVESGFAEGVAVPFQAGHFAGFAADACGGVHQLADLDIRDSPRRPGHVPACPEIRIISVEAWLIVAPYAFSTFTRKPLDSGVWAFGSVTVGVSKFAGVRAFLPSSSSIPRKPW